MSKGVWLALAAVAGVACKSSPFSGITDTIAGGIATADTTIFEDDLLLVQAEAVYVFGEGLPISVEWALSDTSKLEASALPDFALAVSPKDTGSSWVFAVVNEEFRDSVEITVVGPGALRWRVALAGPPALYPAVTDEGSVVVVHGGPAATSTTYSPAGAEVVSATACDGAMGPSVTSTKVFTTGTACTARHDTAGGTDWTFPNGSPGGGVALASDGGAVVLFADGTPLDVVAVSRIGPTGVELWRDTLRSEGLAQESAPAIATNGDIYVPWHAPADSSWLSRIASDGTVRWTMPLPGPPRFTGPAISGRRIVIGYEGGVIEFDSSGTVTWSHPFTDEFPAATSGTRASSPVIDGLGNVYVQSEAGLVSYLVGGTAQWATDSVGFGVASDGVGAPVLLVTGLMLVPCGGEACAVLQSTGAQVWRSSVLGGAARGVVVGNDGTVLVTRSAGGSGELVALWGRGIVEPLGWPAAGGSIARTRRAN